MLMQTSEVFYKLPRLAALPDKSSSNIESSHPTSQSVIVGQGTSNFKLQLGWNFSPVRPQSAALWRIRSSPLVLVLVLDATVAG